MNLSQTIDFSSAREPGLCPEGVHLFKLEGARFKHEDNNLLYISLNYVVESEEKEANGASFSAFFNVGRSASLWRLKQLMMAYGLNEDQLNSYNFDENQIVKDFKDKYIGMHIVHNTATNKEGIEKTYANIKDIFPESEYKKIRQAYVDHFENTDAAPYSDDSPSDETKERPQVRTANETKTAYKVGDLVRIKDGTGEWVGKITKIREDDFDAVDNSDGKTYRAKLEHVTEVVK